jgi:predicted AAA+ superfamily ATPase
MSDRTYDRITVAPKGSFFLFGLRGVGKSAWVRHRFPHAHVVDLLDERRYHSLAADPGLLALELETIAPDVPVVLDEVQRVPALLNEVHRAIESDRSRRFVLVGSSSRRLKTAGTNLLAGRAALRTMYPLVPAELGADFSLDRVLRYGVIPLIWRAEEPEAALEAYVQLYIRAEIRAEAAVRNLPGFLRFLPVAALCHSQTINVSGLARDAGVARTTVHPSRPLSVSISSRVTSFLSTLYQRRVAVRIPPSPSIRTARGSGEYRAVTFFY